MLNRYSTRPAFIALLAFFTLASCAGNNDVSAIRHLIEKCASLAEEHDFSGIMKLAKDDFSAMPGELDRRGTKGILWRAFRYYGSFKVIHPQPNVTLEPDGAGASATVPFLIVGKEHSFPKLREFYKDPQRWIEEAGESADLYRLKLKLIKKDGDWLVKRALLEKFRGLGW